MFQQKNKYVERWNEQQNKLININNKELASFSRQQVTLRTIIPNERKRESGEERTD